jgi:soluble lytic murein transglycosylase-like protein
MRSTRLAVLCAALTTLALSAFASLVVPSAADAAKRSNPCANRLCTKDVADTPSCWRNDGRRETARCFIARAAAHYGQSRSRAFQIAYRESRYNWRVTNSSSGAAGLFQFMPRTWEHTPYRRHSPYHPRWAALAAMWMWKHGYYSHWSTG